MLVVIKVSQTSKISLKVLWHVAQHLDEVKWHQVAKNDSWSSFFHIVHVFLVFHFHPFSHFFMCLHLLPKLFTSSWFFSSYYLDYLLLLISSITSMLDFSSSKTMNFNYLVMETLLKIDDLELIAQFEDYYSSNGPSRYMGDNFITKIKEKLVESGTF